MPDPAYVGGGAFASTATKDSALTVNYPEGGTVSTSAGHYAILEVQTVEQGTGNTAPSIVGPASGWRQIGREIHASGFANTRQIRKRFYGRLLQTSDAAPTVSMTGGTAAGVNVSGKISTFSNVGVIRLGVTAVGDGAISIPGITTKSANELVLGFVSQADGNTVTSAAFTDPSAPTERHDHTVGARVGIAMYTGTRATAGATGAFTATPSGIDPWVGIVMSLGETDTFGGTAVLDDANRANEGPPPSANWAGNMSVISNQFGSVSGAASGYYTAALAQADGEVYATESVRPANGGRTGVYYRIIDPDGVGQDGYLLDAYRDDAEADYALLYRIDNTVWTFIGTAYQERVAGDRYGVRFTGSTHEVYVVPTSGPKIHAATLTEGTYTGTGNLGLFVSDTTARLDNFGGGSMVAAGGIGFNMDATAIFTGVPRVGIRIGANFVGDVDMTMSIISGTPWPGGPGAGAGGLSKGKTAVLLRRRFRRAT